VKMTDEKRKANECDKAEAYFHRWKVDKIATMDVSNAIPELESGEFLPRMYIEVVLKCTACGAGLWYENVAEVDVEKYTYFPPK